MLRFASLFVILLSKSSVRSSNGLTCCKCIPFFLCGTGVVDHPILEELSPAGNEVAETNVDQCRRPLNICCPTDESKDSSECKSFNKGLPSINKNPQPNIYCECRPYLICPLEDIIADGSGVVGGRLAGTGIPAHKKCTEPEQVCCHSIDNIETSLSVDPSKNSCTCTKTEDCQTKDGVAFFGNGILMPRSGQPQKCKDDEVCCYGNGNVIRYSSLLVVVFLIFGFALR